MFLCLSHPEVAYTLAADADKKEKSLIPRATFIDGGGSESKGTISLDSKAKQKCVQRRLQIQVATPSANSSLLNEVHCGRDVMFRHVSAGKDQR